MQATAFHDLSNLKTLDISSNKLIRVMDNRFTYIPMIETIYMARNNITYIHEFTFTDLTRLQHLDLSQNQLTSDNFVNFGSPLKHLNLANNQYKMFDISKLDAIGQVNLSSNPWNCTWLVNEFVDKMHQVANIQFGHRLNGFDTKDLTKRNVEDVTCYEYHNDDSAALTTRSIIFIEPHIDTSGTNAIDEDVVII